MSYNYQINYNTFQKKSNASKYSHQHNENDSTTYIFELCLVDKIDNTKIIRRISKLNQGNLISSEDNIIYDSFLKFKLTVLDINNPDKLIIVKDYLYPNLTMVSIVNKDIYLEIFQTSENYMDFYYNIN
jgi:hypothetical protein